MVDAIEKADGTSQLESVAPPSILHTSAGLSDGVTLSETAQAKLLQEEGLNVAEIADQLGTTESIISGELEVVVTNSQPAVPTA